MHPSATASTEPSRRSPDKAREVSTPLRSICHRATKLDLTPVSFPVSFGQTRLGRHHRYPPRLNPVYEPGMGKLHLGMTHMDDRRLNPVYEPGMGKPFLYVDDIGLYRES